MTEKLLAHFEKFIEFKDADKQKIASYFQPMTFNKKENLTDRYGICKFHFFVAKGCLRMFFVKESGIEQTVQFAIENWWLTDYLAFEMQAPTEFIIQAVEITEVLAIDYKRQQQLFNEFPQLESYFRKIYQRAYGALQLRTKFYYDLSREQSYHHFNNNFPDFTNRIPQYLLASYLNMTPEYLSEIKKNAMKSE